MTNAFSSTATLKPPGGLALVIGASGGIGAALLTQLQQDDRFERVLGLSRHSQPALDLLQHGQAKVLPVIPQLIIQLKHLSLRITKFNVSLERLS